MTEKILFVDDEPYVLDGIRRQLRKKFDVATCDDPERGVGVVEEEGPFAVVVSDMRMPAMNGSQFLARVRERCPDSICMILSGQSDLDAAIEAVNRGNLFRFLLKPCSPEALEASLNLGLEQHRLVTGERELLDKTLSGSIQVLTEILSLAHPQAFSRAKRLQDYMDSVSGEMGIEDRWELRLAALFSQIGCISLPPEVVSKAGDGEVLTEAQAEMFADHPRVAAKLLANIPRLQRVAKMVENQMQRPGPEDLEKPISEWAATDFGAQALRAVTEFDRLLSKDICHARAIERLSKPANQVPLPILEALRSVELASVQMVKKTLDVEQLRPGMVFLEDVVALSGVLLAREDQEVTDTMIARLRNFHRGAGVQEPLSVLVPV